MTSPPLPSADLLQRSVERERLAAAIERATAGEGSVVLLSGPAGIGKTALLREARAAGEAAGMLALGAVGSELDRAFPFGLVHQLFEVELADATEERRAHLTSGAARHGQVIFDLGEQSATEPGHAILHGLYWMCANFTDERPLLLVIDDLHWGDRASLRFLEYLARRLDGLPALVIATVRTGEPGTDDELIDRLHDVPGGELVSPGPLDAEAAATVVERVLGSPPEAAFVRAAHAATGGNPFLLRALADAAVDRGWRGTAAEAGRVDELGEGAGGVLRRRLRTLGPAATTLAHAAAVLGARRAPEDAVAVAGIPPVEARAALGVLSGAGLLLPGSLQFAHPLLRAAAEAAAPPPEVAELHARAARHLRAAGARAEELAVHLLHAPPSGDASLVDTLAAAARAAVAEGAPDAAVPYLERALAEPPALDRRAGLLLELGLAEQMSALPAAEPHLAAALEAGLPGDGAANAWAARGRIALTHDPGMALTAFEAGLAHAESDDLRLRIEAAMLDATAYLASLAERRRELLDAAAAADPSPAMLAHLAQDSAYRGRPTPETLALVDRALADGRLLEVVGPTSATFHLLILTLRHTEQPALADALLTEAEAGVAKSGSLLGRMYNDHVRGFWHLMFGSLATAEASARVALAAVEGNGMPLPELAARILLAEILLERDQTDEAARLVDQLPDGPLLDDAIVGPDALSVRALVRIGQGRRGEAEADLRRAVTQIDRRGWRAPLKSRARLRLAELLSDTDRAQAEIFALQDVEAARGAETNGALGASLRALARTREGHAAVEVLREAEAALAASPLQLEHGWALHDVGRALRIGGARAESREPLRRALDLADRLDAPRLRRMVRDELGAAGARPRRTALSGVESLTPSERRVAELAAAGQSNREIAEALWVTRKTVEVHLGKVYGKLEIRSRAQLPDALGLGDAAT